jgi:hypothetical protein
MDRELSLRLGGAVALAGSPATAIASTDRWTGTLRGVPLSASFDGVAAE